MILKCHSCGYTAAYSINDIENQVLESITEIYVRCKGCDHTIPIDTRWGLPQTPLIQQAEVLEEGDTVVITNQEHVWFNEIGLVCDCKTNFVRLEVNGKRIWMPTHWVKKHDLYDFGS